MRFLPFYLAISELFCIFALTNFRIMVYYRYLFRNEWGLSPNEGLVYSALLSHSLMTSENFEINGSFSMEYARTFVAENMEIYGEECIELNPVSTRKLTKVLGMKEDTIRRIRHDLVYKYNLMRRSVIICPLELLEAGYIDIPSNTKLKGRQLTFYGLLKDRGRLYNGVIDTWASKLADIAGINSTNAHKLIVELQKKGFVERMPDGKLKIK